MDIKRISARKIQAELVRAFGQIYCSPAPEVLHLLQQALDTERDEIACDMLSDILENDRIAAAEGLPACQDTGLPVIFAQLGCEVLLEGGCLREILEAAAAEAWQQFFLRRSIVSDPLFDRRPEAKKVPLILHLSQVQGDKLILDIGLKGGGAENTSALKLFEPTASAEEVEEFIVETVVNSGGRSCPPVLVGVGIGGNFELCAVLAKQALFSCEDEPDPAYRAMAASILAKINARGRGVQGFAGATTALSVQILSAPCHIASLPVAVNLDCHCHRHFRVVL